MISFEPSDIQQAAIDVARDFSRNVLRPNARGIDQAGRLDDGILDQIWQLGLVQSYLDGQADPDGQSQSAVLSALVLEELAWGDAVFALAAGTPFGFVRAIQEQGSARQKAELLPSFTGDRFMAAAVLLMESGGRDQTRPAAKLHGANGEMRLSARKIMTPLAGRCRQFLVILDGGQRKDAVIVPASAPGVRVEPAQPLLGLAGLEMAAVTFEDVLITSDMHLGENVPPDIDRIVGASRTAIAAVLTGLCRAVYEHTIAYTKERVAHGAPLARKQSVAFRIADMFIETNAMRWMTWRAAGQLDGAADATRSAQLAHRYATKQASWITDEGVQLMGGHGYMRANPVELWYRNAHTLKLLEGVAAV